MTSFGSRVAYQALASYIIIIAMYGHVPIITDTCKYHVSNMPAHAIYILAIYMRYTTLRISRASYAWRVHGPC